MKLTKLIPELLEKVDDGTMGFTIAVELASLTEKIRRLCWKQWKAHWVHQICPRQFGSKIAGRRKIQPRKIEEFLSEIKQKDVDRVVSK